MSTKPAVAHGVLELVVVAGERASEPAATAGAGATAEQRRHGIEKALLVAGELELHDQPFGSPRNWWAMRLSCIS